MVSASTLLKIAALMLIVNSQTTFCDATQSQDIVLTWNVRDQLNSTSHTFNFNSSGFSQFYGCLCRNNTENCGVAKSPDNHEYTIYRELKSNDTHYKFEKPYTCYLQTSTTDNKIFCGRTIPGRCIPSQMCITYKSDSNHSACDDDTVEIVSTYVTHVNVNVNDWLMQERNCNTGSTLCGSTTFSPPPSFTSESPSSAFKSTSTLSNTSHATPTVSIPNQTLSTSIHDFVTKTTQSVSTSSAGPTVTTSVIPTAIVTTSSAANNTRLTEEEDDNNNLVTIILGIALGVVVIIATVIIIVVVFWRRRKGNPTSALSRKNHGNHTGDYETPYEMSDVSTSLAENSNSQAPVSVPGPNSYATVDLEKKHRNRKGKNSKKNSKGDHVYNNENVSKTLGKKGQGKSDNVTSHVADYYNLDPQRNEPKPPNSTVYANKDITSVKSNVDEYSIVNKTSTSAYSNATNNSNDSSSSNNNANSTENSTDDEKNRLGHFGQPQGSNLENIENRLMEQNDDQCQDSGPEYSRLHETQRHFQNPYNFLPDQVPDSKTTSTTQPTSDDPNSSSFNINTDTTSAYSLATPISK